MKHITTEEVLQELAAGNCTIKGLAAKFGLTIGSMKGVIANLEISSKKTEPEPIMDNSPASEEDEWKKLYKDYDLEGTIGTQAQFIIAQCRVINGMTAAQARQYMKDNFHYQTMEIKLNK